MYKRQGYTCGVPVGGSVAALSGVEEPPGVGAGVGVAVSGKCGNAAAHRYPAGVPRAGYCGDAYSHPGHYRGPAAEMCIRDRGDIPGYSPICGIMAQHPALQLIFNYLL